MSRPPDNLKAFKVLSQLERVLEGRREEPADAADLRHGLLQRQGAEGTPSSRLAEAKKRDHRKAGSRTRALHLPPVGAWRTHSGLGNGTTLWNLLAEYMRVRRSSRRATSSCGRRLYTTRQLWETSGHWEHYRGEHAARWSRKARPFSLKPMNCPGHMLVFAEPRCRSYRDLPLRYHDQSVLHRERGLWRTGRDSHARSPILPRTTRTVS